MDIKKMIATLNGDLEPIRAAVDLARSGKFTVEEDGVDVTQAWADRLEETIVHVESLMESCRLGNP